MSSAASIPWIGIGVISSLICSSSVVLAEPVEPGDRLLLAQQVVNGLPPPPPSFRQGTSPAQPSFVPSAVPSAASPAIPAAQQYAVIINGDSSMMLDQVRSIEPGAFVQHYQGRRMIQAGIFSDISGAQQQVVALAGRGIGAQVVTLPGGGGATVGTAPSRMATPQVTAPALPTPASFPSPSAPPAAPQVTAPMLPPPDLLPVTPVPREVEFGQPSAPEQFVNPAPSAAPTETLLPPDSAPGDTRNRRSFYVVIPGKSDNLTAISNQVMRLGDGFGIAQMVQTSTSSRGPHVRVGPFVDRGAARRWTRYFRDFGLNARILYTR
ncbi:hypothetical protein NDI45_18335 [Leptolyngbya sp. GB1-A1]|uniref:hypothetical protein n=1 Tax=Leptolyngbya sp. GB1-A1 TaxID=2933908 RepID=UPI00329882CE